MMEQDGTRNADGLEALKTEARAQLEVERREGTQKECLISELQFQLRNYQVDSDDEEADEVTRMSSATQRVSSWEPPELGWRQVDGKWIPPEFSRKQQRRLNLRTAKGDLCPDVVLEAALAGRLIPMVGAGVSCIPPTRLPSWSQVDCAVLAAIGNRCSLAEGGKLDARVQAALDRITRAVEGTLKDDNIPPEYFAEILVNRLGEFYFQVLSVLDSSTPNAVHQVPQAVEPGSGGAMRGTSEYCVSCLKLPLARLLCTLNPRLELESRLV